MVNQYQQSEQPGLHLNHWTQKGWWQTRMESEVQALHMYTC